MSDLKYMFTLHGPTADGNGLMESWEIPKEMYLHMRARMESEPMATSLTDGSGRLISTRFSEDGE